MNGGSSIQLQVLCLEIYRGSRDVAFGTRGAVRHGSTHDSFRSRYLDRVRVVLRAADFELLDLDHLAGLV
jgi:hypothetical protein